MPRLGGQPNPSLLQTRSFTWAGRQPGSMHCRGDTRTLSPGTAVSPGRWAAQAGARSSLGQGCGGACLELRMGRRMRKGSPSPLPGDTPSLGVLTPHAQHHGGCGGEQPWLSFLGLSHGHAAGMCWAHQGLSSPGAGHSDRGTRAFGIVLSGQHRGAWLGTPLRTEPSLGELGSPLTREPRAPLSRTPPTSCPAGPCTGTEAPLGRVPVGVGWLPGPPPLPFHQAPGSSFGSASSHQVLTTPGRRPRPGERLSSQSHKRPGQGSGPCGRSHHSNLWSIWPTAQPSSCPQPPGPGPLALASSAAPATAATQP